MTVYYSTIWNPVLGKHQPCCNRITMYKPEFWNKHLQLCSGPPSGSHRHCENHTNYDLFVVRPGNVWCHARNDINHFSYSGSISPTSVWLIFLPWIFVILITLLQVASMGARPKCYLYFSNVSTSERRCYIYNVFSHCLLCCKNTNVAGMGVGLKFCLYFINQPIIECVCIFNIHGLMA